MNREARRGVEFKRKLFNGKTTAPEYHAAHAFPAGSKCLTCSRPPATRIVVFVPEDEMKKIDPLYELLKQARPNDVLAQMVQFKHGWHVKWKEIFACQSCTPAAERAAAKMPSWCVVEVRRAPKHPGIVIATT